MSIYWELLMVVEGDWRFRGKERVSYTQGMIGYPPIWIIRLMGISLCENCIYDTLQDLKDQVHINLEPKQ